MYDRLLGELVELTPTSAVLEVQGVGYDLAVPLSTSNRLKGKKGEQGVRLYTHLYVREDDLRLYGFATQQERALFRLFMAVSGVGPSIGLACLSRLSPTDAIEAISGGDAATLQQVKGVGKRVAERIIVDLRERAQALTLDAPTAGHGPADPPSSTSLDATVQEDVVRALIELGFQRKSAQDRVQKAASSLGPAGAGARSGERETLVEQLIKECLQ